MSAISATMLGSHYGAGSELIILKGSRNQPLVIAGYASVDVVDKQNDLITLDALKDASDKFMKGEYKNVMITHSNVQVGEVLNNWSDSKGNVLKTGVDETGLFVVIKMRQDIEKAKEVARDIRRGKLRSFSIGGQALHKANKYDADIGTYKEIDKLELHEVTICEEGINPEAKFEIIKENKNEEVNMTETEIEKALVEFTDVVEELRKQVNISKEMPDEDEESAEYSDDAEVLDEADYAKAEDEEEVEEADLEVKADSIVYGHNATGNKIEGTVKTHADSEFREYIKSTDAPTLDLSDENLAKAYAQFKAEREEARAYDIIKNQFESRYEGELQSDADALAKSKYDASAEVNALKNEFADLRKSLENNNDVIVKQVESVQQQREIPEELVMKMQNLHELSWDELEELKKELQQ
tara:strand:- start:3542 stop:4780 length:1239 start_codon:yes stop_codon:yes gene_type:complete